MSDRRAPPATANERGTIESPSRRELLRRSGGFGTAALTGLAGCLSGRSNEPKYRLSTTRLGDTPGDAFRWEARGRFADEDRALMDDLVAEGSTTTVGFALYPGARDEPLYVERDGTYYRFTVERTGDVERERWLLWFDLLDREPSADAEVFTSGLGRGAGTDLAAEYGLSERDVRVVEDAVGEIPTEFEFRDLEEAPPGRRGHVFVRRAAAETDLVPDPPFTHVVFETGDGARYARAVAERATVSLRRYEHVVEPVARSAAEYAEHVRERHVRTTFDRASLSEEQRAILDDATSGRRYEERPPLSDAMTAILDRLGLGDVATPEPRRVTFSDEVYFGYGDAYFESQLEILR